MGLQVCCYLFRQWLITDYFTDNIDVLDKELSLTTLVLENDPLNNSMWVYRMFIITMVERDLSTELDFCSKLVGVDDVITDYLSEIIAKLDKDVVSNWLNSNRDKKDMYKLIANIA